jgi:membrane protein YdbS with pleckstrin-like domain
MLIKEKNKIRVFIYGSMVLALVLGIYGQSISYYLNDNLLKLSVVDWLIVVTITSIFLFLIPPILAYKLNKKQKIDKEELNIYFAINISIGIITSLWSIIVLIAGLD